MNAVAPISTASEPPATRCQRLSNQLTSTRSVTRNHIPALTALDTAASRLMRIAMVGAIGRIVATRPMSTKSGFPGGCGRPKV